MYVSFEDIRKLIVTDQSTAEDPGIFIEYMGRCYEPEEVTIDEDGDIIIRI